MRRSIRRWAPVAIALALVAAAAAPALAQTREFAGRVVSIGGRQLVVESRQGETLRFVRGEKTRVEGARGWGAIQAGDRVVVGWSLGDGPREARRVIVLGGKR